MRPIAKRLVLGLAAPAEGDRIFAGGDDEFVPEMIYYFDDSLDEQRAVLARANNYFCHRLSPPKK
jgi:hypothetical protein